jgi:sugar lactone lactonase YvrE
LAVDAAGNVYVTDTFLIRKVNPTGVVTTLAGSTNRGNDDGTGRAATFNEPAGVAVDAAGNVYVADTENDSIRKISPAGVVTTLAGGEGPGEQDGTGAAARFFGPRGVAVDATGHLYVADTGNNLIRKVSPAGAVTTLAGTRVKFVGSQVIRFADGTGADAVFNSPNGVAVDGSGNVYVADTENNCIRKVSPASVVTTLAGSIQGFEDGAGATAKFFLPRGVAVDGSGNVYVADRGNERIRKIQ